MKPPGFEPPRAHVVIEMGSVTHRLALGGDAPTPAGAGYVRLDGGDTLVVGRDLVLALLQGADTYRSRMLVPYVSVELARLDLKMARGAAVTVERVDDVSFKLVPSGIRASRSKLDAVWGAPRPRCAPSRSSRAPLPRPSSSRPSSRSP